MWIKYIFNWQIKMHTKNSFYERHYKKIGFGRRTISSPNKPLSSPNRRGHENGFVASSTFESRSPKVAPRNCVSAHNTWILRDEIGHMFNWVYRFNLWFQWTAAAADKWGVEAHVPRNWPVQIATDRTASNSSKVGLTCHYNCRISLERKGKGTDRT